MSVTVKPPDSSVDRPDASEIPIVLSTQIDGTTPIRCIGIAHFSSRTNRYADSIDAAEKGMRKRVHQMEGDYIIDPLLHMTNDDGIVATMYCKVGKYISDETIVGSSE